MDNSWDKYYIDMDKNISYGNESMYSLIKKTCEKYPRSIAYSYFKNDVTYKRMLKKIDNIAYSFTKIGVTKDDIVTICMPNTPEAILSFYALNKLGVKANIIHPLSSEEEIKNYINNTKSKYLLMIDMVFPKVRNIINDVKLNKIIYSSVGDSMDVSTKFGYFFTRGIKILTPYGDNVISFKEFYQKGEVKSISDGENVAAILYSGGTTGKSKGIILTNNNFNSLILSELSINKVLTHGTSMLAIMPIFHGFGLGCTFHACFVSGARAIILPSVDPKKFDEVLINNKPNVIACVPSILEGITYSKKLKDKSLDFIKCVVCGGDSISNSLLNRVNDFLKDKGSVAKVRCAYGLTECTAGVTMMPLETCREGSVGVPIPGVLIKICKCGTTKEEEILKDGEICVSGPCVMREYYNEKDETKNILKKHSDGRIWLHTGDLGCMDKEGFVYFKSRIKRMIVSSGYNVYPSVIEEVIMKSPYVRECAVVGMPHPYKKEVAKAYIVLKDGIELTSEVKKSIKALCEKNIPTYALPYAYGYRKVLPKTKVGKIAYNDLKDEEDD